MTLVRRPSSFYSFPGEVLFRASYWYVSIQKLPFSSRLLSACGATPGHVSVLLERSWECSGSMRKNKETCERLKPSVCMVSVVLIKLCSKMHHNLSQEWEKS